VPLTGDPRGFGVAIDGGRPDDRLELGDRGVDTLGIDERVSAEHGDASVNDPKALGQDGIARALGQRSKEFRLDGLATIDVSAPVFGVEPIAQPHERTTLGGSRVHRKQLPCKGFHRGAHHIQRPDRGLTEHRDQRTQVRPHLDQLFRLKLTQRLPDHGSGNSMTFAKGVLEQSLTRRENSVQPRE
jgi:hypothetical protein